jgi:alkanesulfonate monooxygenase SsuD/methylene tetrahydromethanopterin reductase-like flavin-dependent oxidoreductase (luciferase family)
MDALWTPPEKAAVESKLAGSIIGGAAAIKEGAQKILEATKADELIINAMIYDHEARLRSYEIIADVFQNKAAKSAALRSRL